MANNSSKLTDQHIEYVLRACACGIGPTAIVQMLAEEFGVKCSHANIIYHRDHNPERIAGLRVQLNDDIAAIPTANKLNRVAMLDVMARRSFERKQFADCRASLRQIAEETGDIRDGTIINLPPVIEVCRDAHSE